MECRNNHDRFTFGVGGNMTSTKVVSVGNKSKSVRTVIPMWIAEIMELKKGDSINWKIIWDSENKTRSIEIVKVGVE